MSDDCTAEAASSYQALVDDHVEVDDDVEVSVQRPDSIILQSPLLSCLWRFVQCCFPRERHAVGLSDGAVNPEIYTGLTGRCGLVNLGNTCYMNSALQCLSSTTPLREYFIGEFLEDKDGAGGTLAISFSNLLQDMWSGKPSAVKPSDLKKLVGSYVNRFSGFSQQDSQEFLTYLLQGLHEDLNTPTYVREDEEPRVLSNKEEQRLSDKELAELKWTQYVVHNNSKIVELFQGQLKISLTCGNKECGKVDRSFDPFMFLTVPLPDGSMTAPFANESLSKLCHVSCTLYDCLKFLTQEKCSEEKNWFCEGCKKDVEIKRKVDIWKLPEILIVHLKRFRATHEGRYKLDMEVDFPLNLDLCKLTNNPGDPQQLLQYNLFAIIDHQGTIHGGHYTATTKLNGNWCLCDDQQVTSVSLQEVKQAHAAYVLFYQRETLLVSVNAEIEGSKVEDSVDRMKPVNTSYELHQLV